MGDETTYDFSACSALIGLIYDTANDPMRWPDLLEAMTECAEASADGMAFLPLDEMEALLRSHFDSAQQMHEQREALNFHNKITHELLDRLPFGVVVTDAHAQVLASNRRAQQLFDAGQTVRLQHGALCANNEANTAVVHALITQQAGRNAELDGAALQVAADGVPNTTLWVLPLTGQIGATVYLTSPLIASPYPVSLLQQSFHLTETEAKVVKAIVNGCHDRATVAQRLEMKVNTVNSHLKRIFHKTQTTNQLQLVKKVLTSPMAMSGSRLPPGLTDDVEQGLPEGCHAIRLRDGRRISYAEYGDAHGKPVIVCHAILGSRLQYPMGETTAAALGLRMIVVDRPGHGYSDFHSGRNLLDWAEDVRQLADQLAFSHFSLLSMSSGSHYLLACACAMPERITRAVMVSACHFGSLSTMSGGLSVDKMMLHMADRMPALFHRYCRTMGALLLMNPHRALAKRMRELPARDIDYLKKNPQHKQENADNIREALQQGTAGASHDIVVYLGDFGFTLAEITIPIVLWHGTQDRTFPLAAARAIAEQLPQSTMHFIDNIGLTLIAERWDDILQGLG